MSEKTDPEKPKLDGPPIPTWIQVRSGIVANLSVISPGINLGFPAIAVPALTALHNPIHLTIEQASWIVSIAAMTMPLGCLISGPVIDKLGRKMALYLINITMIIGWAIISFADTSNVDNLYITLLIGRFITGIGTGLCSVPATVYMSEISTPNLRGMLITWSSIAFALGVQIVYILGYIFKDNWKICAGISGIIPIFIMVITYFLLPESPVWLRNKGRIAAAEKSLRKLQGLHQKPKKNNENQSETFEGNLLVNATPIVIVPAGTNSVYNETSQPCAKKSILERLKENLVYFAKPECWKPFLIMMCYFMFQQFSGIFVVVVYAVELVRETGVQIDPYIAAIMIGSVRTGTSFLVSFISKRFGRRPPSIVSGSGMTLCMLLLSVFLYLTKPTQSGVSLQDVSSKNSSIDFEDFYDIMLQETNSTTSLGSPTSSFLAENFKWLPLLLLMLYFFTSTIGFLTIPFAMLGEVFPLKIRGLASSTTAAICYTCSFIIVKLYPAMLFNFGPSGLFFFYSIISLSGTIFIYFFLPETKGKTLNEIQTEFKGQHVSNNAIIPNETDEKIENS